MELEFDSPLRFDPEVWKTRKEWESQLRFVIQDAKGTSLDGQTRYRRDQTKGVLDSYDLQAWLEQGIPF